MHIALHGGWAMGDQAAGLVRATAIRGDEPTCPISGAVTRGLDGDGAKQYALWRCASAGVEWRMQREVGAACRA